MFRSALACALTVTLFAAGLAAATSTAAQRSGTRAPVRRTAPPPAAAAKGLQLRDVVMFSSGVGYFQRVGQVSGNASVDLTFRAEQINDILKSLVLFDAGGGVRPVNYTTQDPLPRQMTRAGGGLNSSITLGQLLRQFQGAQVSVDLAIGRVEGRIVSVGQKQIPVKGGGTVTVEVLNVMSITGLRSLSLEDVRQVRLLDDRLDRELRSNLALLASSLDDQRKTVGLRFSGEGAREVRAGYLQEMPVWKTSYRLVLDGVKKPYLQGWAIVENTTEEDWKAVNLSLISGRPVSFIQNLYQPLYVPRPVVAPQVVGSPTPQTYGEVLERESDRGGARAPAATAPAAPAGGGGGFGGGREADAFGKQAAPARRRAAELGFSAEAIAGVAAQAEGSERGDLFEYAIKQPVTLPRKQAAMVPIVTETIQGEPMSIYNAAVDARHALVGFQLKNSTGLHLAGGPITVFQSGIYAGDAQITNLQPGEERLISYAVDLELTTAHKEPKVAENTLSIVAKSGVLVVTRKQRREETYTFRNKASSAKNVLVEQAIDPEFTLVEPKEPAEKTASVYRFKVPVPAGQSVEYKVVTERPLTQSLTLVDIDLNLLVDYVQNGKLSPRVKAALEGLVQRRRAITDLQTKRAAIEADLKAIDAEQSRIRQNMAQLDRNGELYRLYVTKLTQQETQIGQLRMETERLRDTEQAAVRDLRVYVDSLTAE